MTNDERQEKLKKLEDAACVARGHVIHRVIEMEMLINFYLAQHFAKDEQRAAELRSLLFCTERMEYSAKVEIFCILLERHNLEFFNSIPKLRNHLLKIGEIRNHMAHLHLNILDEGLTKEDIIGFAKWRKDKIEIKNYSYKNINDLITDLYTLTEAFGTLIK